MMLLLASAATSRLLNEENGNEDRVVKKRDTLHLILVLISLNINLTPVVILQQRITETTSLHGLVAS